MVDWHLIKLLSSHSTIHIREYEPVLPEKLANTELALFVMVSVKDAVKREALVLKGQSVKMSTC